MPNFDGFIGGSYQAASTLLDAQVTFNLYPEFDQAGKGKNIGALMGTPGLAAFATLGAGPIRGVWPGENRLFAVSGANLYEVFYNGTANNRGSVGTDGLPVTILSNGNQLGIISAGQFYLDNGAGPVAITFASNLSGTVSTNGTTVTWVSGDTFNPGLVGGNITINAVVYVVSAYIDEYTLLIASSAGTQVDVPFTAASPVSASSGTFLDGYFIVAQGSNSKLFNYSNLLPLGGAVWDPTDVQTKEAYPDNIAAVFADHEELWVFGDEQSTEVYQDTGAALNPFQPIQGNIVHYGLGAKNSVVRLNTGVAWLAIDVERGGVMAFYAQGFQPVRVSTHAVEAAWNTYSTIVDAVAYSYLDQGHHFWVISFPTANATWVFDATTNLWHQRGWWNGTSLQRDRVAFHAYVALAGSGGGLVPPAHYVGDWQSGVIYKMSTQYTDHAGTAIHRIRACPYIATEISRIFFHRFWVDAQVTAGSDGDNLNLSPLLDWSDDGGVTWSNTHSPRASDYGNGARLVWPRLGASKFKGRVFRVTITDNVPIALVAAGYEATVETKGR